MRCSDLRWRLSPFLNGTLAAVEADELRCHLDLCTSCVTYLVNSGRIEHAISAESASPVSDFANRVAANVPNRSRTGLLSRYFISIVVATLLFAVAVFAFFRHSLFPNPPATSAEESALLKSFESMLPWLEHAVNSPLMQFVFFSLVATLISVALVALVDNPRHPLRRNDS